MVTWKCFKSMDFKVQFRPLLDPFPMDKFEEKQFQEETAKVKADPEYQSWILKEHNFDDLLCRYCDDGWPSLEQWRGKVQSNISRIGTAFHPLKVDTKKSVDHRVRSNYFRECLEQVSKSIA
jgi:hypothetical protein